MIQILYHPIASLIVCVIFFILYFATVEYLAKKFSSESLEHNNHQKGRDVPKTDKKASERLKESEREDE